MARYRTPSGVAEGTPACWPVLNYQDLSWLSGRLVRPAGGALSLNVNENAKCMAATFSTAVVSLCDQPGRP